MPAQSDQPRIYDGEGDRLMESVGQADRIILLPDARPSKTPDRLPRIRILWGQHLLEDLLSGRYRSLVCAVNAVDNSRGIITQLATLLATSQWDQNSITAHAKRFLTPTPGTPGTPGSPAYGNPNAPEAPVKILKFDMDAVEVLAILRPAHRDHLTLADLRIAFPIVAEMLRRKPQRLPSASVSFLGARANVLRDADGQEPSFESVLRVMHEAGYTGDVYPAPAMWEAAPTAVYARYPFPASLEKMREGGF